MLGKIKTVACISAICILFSVSSVYASDSVTPLNGEEQLQDDIHFIRQWLDSDFFDSFLAYSDSVSSNQLGYDDKILMYDKMYAVMFDIRENLRKGVSINEVSQNVPQKTVSNNAVTVSGGTVSGLVGLSVNSIPVNAISDIQETVYSIYHVLIFIGVIGIMILAVGIVRLIMRWFP